MGEDGRKMEAEQRYIAGEETLKDLAEAMGIPLNTIKRWCKAGDWVKKREKLRKRAMKKAVTQAANRKAKELAKLLEAGDELEKALLISARRLAQIAEEKPDIFALTQSKTMLNVSESIERMAHARQMTGGAMSRADEEKLELLRKKQALEERKAALEEKQDKEGVKFTMEEETEGVSE